MKVWRCTVCGYIHNGDEAPEKCPQCRSPKEKFVDSSAQAVQAADGSIHINYTEQLSDKNEVVVNAFFENYESLAPFMYNLPAGQEVKLHKHPTTDEIFYIIKGKFQFRVGSEAFIANPGDIIQGKMNIPHGFKNIGSEAGAFLSVKAPKPVDLEMLEK